MFDLGTQELIVIFIVAFLVFGPKKLPELGRTLGKGIRDLKAAMRGVKETFEEAEEGVTKEIKEAGAELEESVYKSIEPHVSGEEEREEAAGAVQDEKSSPESDAEKKAENKETDKDG